MSQTCRHWKTVLRYSAFVFMMLGLAVMLWNGYSFWQGYRAVTPLKEADKQSSKRLTRAQETLVPPKLGEQMGTLLIPKLHISLPIYHGTDEQELRKGVGHYPKSALPGQPNNVVLSGHRDTVFRQLGQVGLHDELIVKTSTGEFVYRVKKVRIVDESDRTVIVEKPRPTLTVTTCYPFDFIGNAKQRYVLIAQFVKKRT
ncbi:class D sortase [Thermaerobacillus caldiproteolyticus]|uniref:Sortase A n=1 Tax=Thermaerobacillus caldiproteolyticus TaxID=247480 RepID=A0A7V9Z5Z2_9BACL|nr:sortase A [Anoxybacillus caldiproteolyticus]